MTIQDYFRWKEQKKASKNLSLICLRQHHKDIAEEINKILKDGRRY